MKNIFYETSEKYYNNVIPRSGATRNLAFLLKIKNEILRCAQNDQRQLIFQMFLYFILLCSFAFAQVENRKPTVAFDLPDFFVDALSFSSTDSVQSRVDVYVQVPYDALKFVKVNDQYVARYEVTLNFLTDDKASVSEKVWTEEVRVPLFEYTGLKKAFSLTQRSISIVPGIYTLRSQVRDNESRKASSFIKKIIVGNYSMDRLSISDVMLVSKIAQEGDKRNIVPNVSGNIGENNTQFHAFFEIYSTKPSDSLELHYTITDAKGKQLLNQIQNYRLRGNRSQIITRFDSAKYSTGAYLLTVEVKSLHAANDDLPALKQRPFVVRWGNMPISISDLDVAIEQMRYIAKENEMEKIENAKNEQEKRLLFEEFWKKRDTNPDTKQNEFMEEYFSRIEYANKNFSHYRAGWKTDMGMVFILFGSPNNVERHPFDIDSKPYEIWAYYDFNRNIVFVDETGFGDYRLLTPIWDLLQRVRN